MQTVKLMARNLLEIEIKMITIMTPIVPQYQVEI